MRFTIAILLSALTSFSCIAQSSWAECANAIRKGKLTPADPTQNEYEQKFQMYNTCLPGKQAPAFSAITTSGKTITENDLKGKVTLINFWFIGCPPCVKEIPMFNELLEEYKDKGFTIVSFALDEKESLEKFNETKPIDFDVVASSHALVKTFGIVDGYPTNVFVNRKGEAVSYSFGGAMDDAGIARAKSKMRELIEKELANK